jgi:ABC-type glycerol-3-phosphate transport system permease component
MSAEPLSTQLFNARNIFISYLDEYYQFFHIIFIAIMIVLFILFPILNITISFFIIKQEIHDQKMIFKALISIPKGNVSKVLGQFNISSNDIFNDYSTPDISSLNDEDEKTIKLLNNVDDGTNISLNSHLSLIIRTVFMIACHFSATYLLIIYEKREGKYI